MHEHFQDRARGGGGIENYGANVGNSNKRDTTIIIIITIIIILIIIITIIIIWRRLVCFGIRTYAYRGPRSRLYPGGWYSQEGGGRRRES